MPDAASWSNESRTTTVRACRGALAVGARCDLSPSPAFTQTRTGEHRVMSSEVKTKTLQKLCKVAPNRRQIRAFTSSHREGFCGGNIAGVVFQACSFNHADTLRGAFRDHISLQRFTRWRPSPWAETV